MFLSLILAAIPPLYIYSTRCKNASCSPSFSRFYFSSNGWTSSGILPSRSLSTPSTGSNSSAPSVDEIRAHEGLCGDRLLSGFSSGVKTVAVIVVQFPSASATLTSGSKSIQSLPTVDSYFAKMNSYYQEVSQNAIPGLTFKFFGPNTIYGQWRLASATVAEAYFCYLIPWEYYGCGDEGEGCSGVPTPVAGVNANGDYLIADALTAARAGHSNTPAARRCRRYLRCCYRDACRGW